MVQLLVVTIVFACISFVSPPLEGNTIHPLYSFYFNQIRFILNNPAIFFFGLILIPLFFINSEDLKKYPIRQRYLISLSSFFKTSILGFLLSTFFVFAIAIIEINIFALIININPKFLGVESDLSAVAEELSKLSRPPNIIPATLDIKKVPAASAIASTGNDNFFGYNILPSIPGFLILPLNKYPDTFMVNNFLVITKINDRDLGEISPQLAHLLIQSYFQQENIKRYPNVSILGKSDYIKFREADTAQKIKGINQAILDIQNNISSFSAAVETGKSGIDNSAQEIKQAEADRDAQFKVCITSKKPKDVCQKAREEAEVEIATGKSSINEINSLISNSESQLKEYEYYQDLFKKQKEILQFSENSMVHELAVFEPKDKITIVVDEEKTQAAEYIKTLVHEYLHYASFVSNEKKLESLFFEEGFTEFFAAQTITNILSENMQVGYPIQVKIISQITKLITEGELADIYFTKDQEALERALNRVYGDTFYKDSIYLFETLQYTADPKEALKLANDIMKRIGGDPFTEKDLASTTNSVH